MADRNPQSAIRNPKLNRRSAMFGLGATVGTAAFNSMLAADEWTTTRSPDEPPLAPRAGHHPARAKAVIYLYMAGGPSHIDTFDPKPKLEELHMQEFQRKDKFASAMASGKRYYIKSPFQFRKAGESGIEMCTGWEQLSKVADELCVYRGCVGESINHPTANYHMNTGNRFGGDPAMGAWVSYGLGSPNADLPSFVVLPEVNFPQGGSANWSNGYLPAHYQGTPLRPKGSPILDLTPPDGVTRETQRANLDLLATLNSAHAERHPHHDDLAARMDSYELAFRMQSKVPSIVDLDGEPEHVHRLYGLDDPESHEFARRCLLARRLVEKGVRFVQIYAGGWDSHDYLERSHGNRFRIVDRPIAGLIADLRQRGLLDDTLVIWGGEFGRSPDNGVRGGGKRAGRDHNAKAMPLWFAGGGVKAGYVVGATDELGDHAVENVHPIRDVHTTILHLLGLDDAKLTFFHAGRFKQLSQIGGQVIDEIVA